ncbi:MAG: hypothetical protein LQ344_007404 [Seirophora lacunosa]|nr:MAG: hypothetical protein LQ344_007404 [Seirophora lacunosa]
MTGKGKIVPSPKVINPQLASPLFNRLPPEVRNMIFRFALTAYEDPARKYERQAYYYRPGYTCPRKIDIDLLLTCRLVHAETASLPASINEHLSWYWRGPPEAKRNGLPSDSSPGSSLRRRELRSIHIFAQQYWLEQSFAGFTQFWNISCPTHLKITIRHTDWWWWEDQAPLALDPKREDRPLAHIHSSPSDPFEPQSWGAQFRKIRGLQNLQLELETVKSKRSELDAIIARAPGWRFALGDDKTLVLDESKTQRRGWVGHSPSWYDTDGSDTDSNIDIEEEDQEDEEEEEIHVPESIGDPTLSAAILSGEQQLSQTDGEAVKSGTTAPSRPLSTDRQQLEATGVIFDDDDDASVKGLPKSKIATYYVVTMTWQAHSAHASLTL